MNQSKVPLIILLGALAAIGPFSIDMYLPGLPNIAKYFSTDISNVQLTLTSYFFGIAFGQIFYGPLVDRFGRKRPLLIGLAIYLISSVGCALSPSVWALIGFRFLQSLGACAGMVISRAVVRDSFSPHEAAKAFSQILLVMGIAPIIAPSLGGIIIANFSWRVIFFLLVALSSVLLVWCFFLLPETKKPDPQVSLLPSSVFSGFLTVIQVPRFWVYVTLSSLASAVMFAYISGSPFVFMRLFGLGETEYAWVFGLNASGLILSSQLNRILLSKFEAEAVLKNLSRFYLPLGILLICAIYFSWPKFSVYALIFCMVAIYGFIFPNASALALSPFSQNAGSASALMGFLQMVLAVCSSGLVSLLHDGTAFPMVGVMSGLGFLAFGVILFFGAAAHHFELDQKEAIAKS